MFTLFSNKINVLVLGSKGMLGTTLLTTLQKDSYNKNSKFGIVAGLDYPDIDLRQHNALNNFLNYSIHFDYIVNCAAITDTKKIEDDRETRKASYAVNALACKNIAKACRSHGTKLIHISTDYVFSEELRSINNMGFSDEDDEFPINEYGVHKLLGEQFIKSTMFDNEYAILRVSWLYGNIGNKSFIHKFLKNCYSINNEKTKNSNKRVVKVVDDEVSAPTSVDNLCRKIINVMYHEIYGVLNCNDTTCEEIVTRYEFAKEIFNYFTEDFPNISEVVPCETTHNPNTNMRYPAYSKLRDSTNDFLNVGTTNWRMSLAVFMEKHKSDIFDWLKSNS